ncbi:MAG: DUF58 domain-containing protein [Marmoricola sp.]
MTVSPTRNRPGRARPSAGFREGLGSLTARGRGFVAGGVTAATAGLVLGERDLVRIGFLVALLPLLTAGITGLSSNRLSLTRTLAATQVEVGTTMDVQLELVNVGSTTGLLLVEEQVPWALGQRPRFVIDAMQPGWHRKVSYPVRAEVRGIYEIGPMRLRVADPFGMLSLNRTFTKTSSLVVIPVAEPLPAIHLGGAWSGSGDNRPRPFSIGSAADVTVREYRRGDDLRRVHWRSTARVGELMVRREEQPWQSRCTLFVDNRAGSHRGSGPDSSLERAITVAASIAVHLSDRGYQVRLVSADGEEVDHAWHDGDVAAHARPVLERLAVLPTTRTADISGSWVDETVTGGMFIGVFGGLTADDRAFLSRLHGAGSASFAVLLDVAGWIGRTAPDVPVEHHREDVVDWLHRRGWKAAELARWEPVATAWQELGR